MLKRKIGCLILCSMLIGEMILKLSEWVDHEYDADHDHLWSYDEYTEEFTLLFQ